MQPVNISIVILNYLNYMDTIECLESIQDKFENRYPIVVVDNCSSNESAQVLAGYCKKHERIRFICARRNYGFAKGNNIGINYARKVFYSDYVLVINNDTLIIDKHYIDRLLSKYQPGIGVLGSKVVLKSGSIQNRLYFSFACRDVFRLIRGSKSSWDLLIPTTSNVKRSEYLHGCALMFTPDFFLHYKGFDPRTFLYGEELLLFIMCENLGLTQKYVSETSIFHKEDCSSNMSFHNDSNVMNSYLRDSLRIVFYELLKKTIKDRFRIIRRIYDKSL